MINYVKGDATLPQGAGLRFIVHCCNDAGLWGAGFALALSKRYPEARQQYVEQAAYLLLGDVQYVKVARGLCVANIIGQHGVRTQSNPKPIRYAAIEAGLVQVANKARFYHASIHMPRMGAGLAGGDWAIIEKLILVACKDVDVTVYDL